MNDPTDDPPRPVITDVWQNPSDVQPAIMLTEEESQSGVLAYRSSREVPPMSIRLAKWLLGLSAVPSLVGLGTLAMYWLTAADAFPQFGLFWLPGGGALAFSLGVIGIVNTVRAQSRRPRDAAARYYGWIIVTSLASVPVAIFCANYGSALTDRPHPRVRITNATTRPIDGITVHFHSGDVAVGGLSPGQHVTTGWAWRDHNGDLFVTVRVGNATRKKIDRGGVNRYSLKENPFEVTIEDNELPKAIP